MTINRLNYESFFLLYADNELSAQERIAVESFLQENVDLQSELKLIEQTILEPEICIFNNKHNLIKPEENDNAIEEGLLLYIDNELTENDLIRLSHLIDTDIKTSEALHLLQQTKLSTTEKIVFPNKHLLYKKERTITQSFGWWKLAAAAVFIGFGLWSTLKYSGNDKKADIIQIAIKKGKTANKIPDRFTMPVDKTNDNSDIVKQAVTTFDKPNRISKKVREIQKISTQINQTIPSPKEIQTLVVSKKIEVNPNNNLPKPYFKNNKINKTQEDELTDETIQNPHNDDHLTTAHEPIEQKNKVYAASFTESNNDLKEDLFTFTEDEPKKSKLTEIIRKAKRVLERNTKSKLGNDVVKIATFALTNN